MLEMMAVVAIIVVLCGIVGISTGSVSKSMRFQEYNDHAKTIFMAAQANLSRLRSTGDLAQLRAEDMDHKQITAALKSHVAFPEDEWSAEYYFTASGDEGLASSFAMVLPANSVETYVRDQSVLIEYNPFTGNVYSVFYSEEEDLKSLYLSGHLPRDEESRKKKNIGYYCGTGLSSQSVDLEQVTTGLEFSNGEEGILKLTLPIPEALSGNGHEFINGLDVTLTLTGEISGASATFNILNHDGDDLAEANWSYGDTVQVSYTVDSLANLSSFANFAAGTYGETVSLTAISDQSLFTFLPGENLSARAFATYTGISAEVDIAPAILGSFNPMFDYLMPGITHGQYVLGISNGRNLQNLNALAPQIADAVESVVFTDDIYWDDTVSYYNNVYGDGGTYSNSSAEAPARSLPYFVPIHNELLLGTASFDGVNLVYNHEVQVSGEALIARDFADVVGNGHKVVGLNIDATRYATPEGEKYYVTSGYTNAADQLVGGYQKVHYQFTGLFAYANTNISGLQVVNSFVKGMGFGTNDSITLATGSLVGVAGFNAFISDCGAYIFKDAHYDAAAMSGPKAYDGGAAQSWYGVSGEGAVGGLVGHALSNRIANGNLVDDSENLTFRRCFAAVPVSGNMRGNGNKNYGFTNGVGGLVGVSHLSNFFSCYASGDVLANGVHVTDRATSWSFINRNGQTSMGVGGFIGTSHGSRYTNCFATGDVLGRGAAGGAGGFVGVMCYDGGFECSAGSVTKTFKQLTIFESCYSVGQVQVNDGKTDNFSGCIASVNLSEYISGDSKIYTDFYLMYAPYCYDKGVSADVVIPDLYTTRGGYFYMYKDCYYLDRSSNSSVVYPNTSGCGGGASLSTMKNLLGNHSGTESVWIATQVGSLLWNDNLSWYFWTKPEMVATYYQAMADGYPNACWAKATAATTHAYAVDAGVYPFPSINGLDYYGDWPGIGA